MKSLVMVVALVLVSSSAFGVTLFSEDFETDLSQWSFDHGQMPTLSTDQAHGGSQSLKFDEIRDQTYHDFPGDQTNVDVSLWFYDNTESNQFFSATVDQATGFVYPAVSVGPRNDMGTSTYTAVFGLANGSVQFFDTGVQRSSEWIEIVYQVRPEGTTVSLGGYTSPVFSQYTTLSSLSLIEHAYDNANGVFYIDDILVTDLGGPDPPGGHTPDPIPEPAALSLFGIGLLCVRRRRR